MNNPAISAIVVIPDRCDTVRETLNALKAQTIASDMEVVFVIPQNAEFQFTAEELEVFNSWNVVKVEKIESIAGGFTAGIYAAKADIAALTEDHSFPDKQWAEVFVREHRDNSRAVVGPSMKNANPVNIISWADFYMAYGPWCSPVKSGETNRIPGHNSSYKKKILLSMDARFPELMNSESVLHRELMSKGYKLFISGDICTSHQNFYRWLVFIAARYYAGRQFAGTWSQYWSAFKRLLYAAASPCIPVLRTMRTYQNVKRTRGIRFYIRILPVVAAGFIVEGFGNFIGFLFGTGDAALKIAEYEFHRMK